MKKQIDMLKFIVTIFTAVILINGCTSGERKKQEVTIDGNYRYENSDIIGRLVIRNGTWYASFRETAANQVIVDGSGSERNGTLYNEYNMRVGSANGTTATLMLPNGESVTLKK